MSGALGTLQLALLAGLCFAVLAALLCGVSYPSVRRWLSFASPTQRARAMLAWIATPLVSAVVLTTTCFLPSLLNALELAGDHCLTHDDAHTHFCLTHLSATGSTAGWLILAVASGWIGWGVVSQVRRLFQTRRWLRLLRVAGDPNATDDIAVVDSLLPVTVTAGLVRSKIYISSALVSSLSEGSLKVILEHERAHVRHRDALRKFVAALLSLGHLPWLRRRLLADFTLACEQSCDEVAAAVVGDRLSVADAIVTVERIFDTHTETLTGGASAFASDHVAERVTALLANERSRREWHAFSVAFVALIIAATVGAESLHHAAETALSLLAR